jgi:hypothetical protein
MTGFDESELLGIAPPYPYWPAEEFDKLQHNIDQALAGQAPAAAVSRCASCARTASALTSASTSRR